MFPELPLQAGGVVLIWLFFMAIFIAMVFWTYSDAKTNSEHPAFLWAIVVFLAPLLGLVLYLLLGRNKRYGRPPGGNTGGSDPGRRPPR
jgi:apolipoprotein N-acyltransferase